jgi:hypothetical protein
MLGIPLFTRLFANPLRSERWLCPRTGVVVKAQVKTRGRIQLGQKFPAETGGRIATAEGLTTDRRILLVFTQSVWPSSTVPSQRTADGLTTDRRILFFFTYLSGLRVVIFLLPAFASSYLLISRHKKYCPAQPRTSIKQHHINRSSAGRRHRQLFRHRSSIGRRLDLPTSSYLN